MCEDGKIVRMERLCKVLLKLVDEMGWDDLLKIVEVSKCRKCRSTEVSKVEGRSAELSKCRSVEMSNVELSEVELSKVDLLLMYCSGRR